MSDITRILFERMAALFGRHPGFRIELTGSQVGVFRNVHLMVEDLWKSLLTAAGMMFLMIWIGLWSWRCALASVIPNVFPLLCAGAFIVLSGRYLEMSSVIVRGINHCLSRCWAQQSREIGSGGALGAV